MDFLTTQAQFTNVGYPLIYFYFIGFIGFALALFRPYWAFLFSLFCIAARNFHAAVFTRTPIFGPYLNLNDLLLWIALSAMFFELIKTRKIFWMPKILFAILILIIIGDIVSLFKYGTEEYVLRRIWSTAVFPILFFVSANMVKNGERAKSFYLAFFFGAVLASVQHMIFIRSATFASMSAGESEIRSISYITSGGLFLVLSSIFVKAGISTKKIKLVLYYIGIALIILSYVLSLTRGIYVIGILSLFIIPFLLKEKNIFSKGAYKFTIIMLLMIFLIQLILPNLDFKAILNKRFESFIYKSTFSKSYETRLEGQKTELELWTDGILIFGQGSSLPPEYEMANPEITGALYHVAYSTYLAHYGLVGLFLYGFAMPISTIFIARRTYSKHFSGYIDRVALIAIFCALFDILALPWSHHHLFATSHISGLIYGSIWGLYRSKKEEEKAETFYKYRSTLLFSSPSLERYGK